jgi:hypothetical protein
MFATFNQGNDAVILDSISSMFVQSQNVQSQVQDWEAQSNFIEAVETYKRLVDTRPDTHECFMSLFQ